MTTQTHPRLIFGTGNVGDSKIDPLVRFDTPEQVEAVISSFHARGHREIDTAQVYSVHAFGTAEPRLGAARAGDRFLLDTKVESLNSGDHKKENILRNINVSLERLKVDSVNILYLHHPDRTVPFEETCEALNSAFTEGKFKSWGLSNYTAEEVEKIVEICDSHQWKRPSVYQGQYNPIVRGAEKDLFPALRKYGMSYYAYSPAAAGFFAGNHKNVVPGGRYDTSHFLGKFYADRYLNDGIQSATATALSKAEEQGISGHAAALRWCAYHSALKPGNGDAIIIGASSVAQLESNLDMIDQGPLPEGVAVAFDAVHKQVELADAEIAYHW